MADIDVVVKPSIINFIGVPVDDDFSAVFTVTQTVNGVTTPLDLTGAQVQTNIVASLALAQPPSLLLMTSTPSVGLTDGKVTVSATAAQLNALGIGAKYYAMRVRKNAFDRTAFMGVFQLIATPVWN